MIVNIKVDYPIFGSVELLKNQKWPKVAKKKIKKKIEWKAQA